VPLVAPPDPLEPLEAPPDPLVVIDVVLGPEVVVAGLPVLVLDAVVLLVVGVPLVELVVVLPLPEPEGRWLLVSSEAHPA
jgi:hypothetical protein